MIRIPCAHRVGYKLSLEDEQIEPRGRVELGGRRAALATLPHFDDLIYTASGYVGRGLVEINICHKMGVGF